MSVKHGLVAIVLSSFSYLYLLLALVWLGQKRPAYSHVHHTISELGELGAPSQQFMAKGVYLPIALMMLVVALIARDSAPIVLLSLSLAVGYLAAACFACDPGLPLYGSFRHGMHQAGGAIEYIGGTFSLMWLSEFHGMLFRVAGLIVGFALLSLSFPVPMRGALQRIAESCLFLGLTYACWLNLLSTV